MASASQATVSGGHLARPFRDLAGHLSVAALRGLRALPPPVAAGLLAPLLPTYVRLRPTRSRRLEALFAASPFAGILDLKTYYRTRLDLLLRCLELHGSPEVRHGLRVEGEGGYLEALGSGRPVALLGLHVGAVELLHRVPTAPEGRPFRIVTAPAFSGPLARYMRLGREVGGKAVLPNRALATGLRGLAKDRGVLAVMADQHPGRPVSWVRLWDRLEVPYPARLLAFLRERDFRIVPVSTRLEPDGSDRFRFHTPWPESAPRDIVSDREALRAFLEEAIAGAPAQWNWSYPKIRLAQVSVSAVAAENGKGRSAGPVPSSIR
jgi:lauroyl/myristoyl acyltransferase